MIQHKHPESCSSVFFNGYTGKAVIYYNPYPTVKNLVQNFKNADSFMIFADMQDPGLLLASFLPY